MSGVTSLTVDKNSSAASTNDIQAEGITKRITDTSSGEIVKRGTILYTPKGSIIGEVTEIAANTITLDEGIETFSNEAYNPVLNI